MNLFRVAIEANRGFEATIIFLRMVFSRVELFEKHCLFKLITLLPTNIMSKFHVIVPTVFNSFISSVSKRRGIPNDCFK